jgi:hypothetical protein
MDRSVIVQASQLGDGTWLVQFADGSSRIVDPVTFAATYKLVGS